MNRGRLPRALTAAVVLISGTAMAMWLPGRADTAAAAAATVSRVVLDEDFSGGRGDEPDPGVWTFEAGRGGLARLTGHGRLLLTSALRTGKTFGPGSGHAEARIRGARADGAWRALGVLDASGRVPAGKVEVLGADRVDADEFHLYAIDWTPTTLTWSLDGRAVLRLTPAEKGRPLAFVLNLGSGGHGSYGMLVDRMRISVQVPVTTPPTVPSAPKWKVYTTYGPGHLVEYRDVVYRVLEPHTALPGWQPNLVPALFARAQPRV